MNVRSRYCIERFMWLELFGGGLISVRELFSVIEGWKCWDGFFVFFYYKNGCCFFEFFF